MITQRTYSLLPQYRWLIAALLHQSSWQAGLDQRPLLVVQGISPLQEFYPNHTAQNINPNAVKLKICKYKTMKQFQLNTIRKIK